LTTRTIPFKTKSGRGLARQIATSINDAFEALNYRGVIAIQNAGYTQSDGYSDVGEVYDSLDDPSVVDYCFYHGQDLERAVHGEGLYLAFGPIDPRKERTDGSRVGRVVVEELSKVGLSAEWDGTFKQRIFVPKLVWRRASPKTKKAARRR
jgi:hypothetical protein